MHAAAFSESGFERATLQYIQWHSAVGNCVTAMCMCIYQVQLAFVYTAVQVWAGSL